MKRKTIVYAIAAIVLVALIIAFVWYFSPKTFLKDIGTGDVASISIFCGSTGKRFTVSDADEIKYIVENIQGANMKRGRISSFYDGFGFSLTFQNASGEAIDYFIINSDTTIRDDPFFYRCDGGLCFAYLQELESNYTSNEE